MKNAFLSYFHRSLLAAIVLLLSTGLSNCGGDSDTGDGGRTVVTFWNFWSEPGPKQALQKQIEEFEAKYPDIDVQMSELSWNDGKTKLLAAFNANNAPDVLELGSDWVAQFSSAGVLADQNASVDAARFAPTVLAPGRWEKGLYAVPWLIETRVLFYNKDLLAGVGVDTTTVDTLWSDVMTHAEKVRAKGGEIYGFGANGPDANRLYKKIIPFFWSNGGDVLDEQGKPVINSAQNIEALRVYLELSRAGLIETQKGLDNKFVQGELAYWISGPWLADRISKDNPALRYGMAPLPTFPGGKSVSFLGGEYLAINEDSEHKDAAAKLVAFLISNEQVVKFCKDLGGYAPADRSTVIDPFQQSAMRKPYTTQIATSRMTPVHPQWLDMQTIIEEEVSAALLGTKSEEEALNAAQNRIVQLLQNDAVASADSAE
jgi:multiple sugar transport system substrate-binding protein